MFKFPKNQAGPFFPAASPAPNPGPGMEQVLNEP